MEVLLQQNELLDLGTKLRNVVIVCQSGSCWLTQAGDRRDYILHAGSSIKIHSKGQVILTASDNCRLQLVPETAKEHNYSFWRNLCCNDPAQ